MKQQSGAVLVISLVFLLLLTLIGVTATFNSIFQARMSANMLNKERAFEAAEAALSEAESWLLSLANSPPASSNCAAQPCVMTLNPSLYPENQNSAWWQSNAAAVTSTLPYVAESPRYYVEYERFVPDDSTLGKGYDVAGTHYYRITARGTGYTESTTTILQTTLGRR